MPMLRGNTGHTTAAIRWPSIGRITIRVSDVGEIIIVLTMVTGTTASIDERRLVTDVFEDPTGTTITSMTRTPVTGERGESATIKLKN